MLINCPRCGFSQPKDQYCASCGVNIETYIPRKESPWKKIFSNTLSQVAVVIAVALGASYYTLRAQDSSSQQSSRRKNIQQTTSNSSLSTSQPTARPEIAGPGEVTGNASPSADVSVELQNDDQRNRLAGASDEFSARAAANPNLKTVAVSATLPATTAAAVAAATPSVKIKVSYYEVSRTILAYWIESNQGNSYGIIPRSLFENQIRYAALKTESTQTPINNKVSFRSDANKDGVLVGLSAEILMNSLNTGSITLTKVTTQGSDNTRADIDKSPQNVFFVYWKNDLVGLQNEAALSEVPPFQILKSRQYLEQKTELVMIIEWLN